MKQETNHLMSGTLLPYRIPGIEAVDLGPQFFLCASSQNGNFENWIHDSDGYNNGDFD